MRLLNPLLPQTGRKLAQSPHRRQVGMPSVQFKGEDSTRPLHTVFMASTPKNQAILREMAALAGALGFQLKIMDRKQVWNAGDFFEKRSLADTVPYAWAQDNLAFHPGRALVMEPANAVLNPYFNQLYAAVPASLKKAVRAVQSNLLGGNYYHAFNQKGDPLILLGENAVRNTQSLLEDELDESVSSKDAIDLIAADLQVKPDKLVLVPNYPETAVKSPLFYHIDLMMKPLKNGQVLLHNFKATDGLLQDALRDIHDKRQEEAIKGTSGPQSREKLDLLESLVTAMRVNNHALYQVYGPVVKQAAKTLEDNHFQVVRVPGVIGHFQYNFINSVATGGNFISNGSDILAIQALCPQGQMEHELAPNVLAVPAFGLQVRNHGVARFVQQVMGEDAQLSLSELGKRMGRTTGSLSFDEYCRIRLKDRSPSLNRLFEEAGIKTFSQRFAEILQKSGVGMDQVFFVKGRTEEHPLGEISSALNGNNAGLHCMVSEYRP